MYIIELTGKLFMFESSKPQNGPFDASQRMNITHQYIHSITTVDLKRAFSMH